MINNQWETCKSCGRDKKYVKFIGNKERLCCKFDCVQPKTRLEIYNSLYRMHMEESLSKMDITEDKASRSANMYAVKSTDYYFYHQHELKSLVL